MPTRDPLGQLLLSKQLVSSDELEQALAEQKQAGGRLGRILVRRGAIAEEELVRALAAQLRVPVARIRAKKVKPEVLALVPVRIAEKYRCLPLMRRSESGGPVLYLALEDPSDRSALDELAFQLGERLRPVLIGPQALEHAIARHYYTGDGPTDAIAPAAAEDGFAPRMAALPEAGFSPPEALSPLGPAGHAPSPDDAEQDTAPELPPADPLLHPTKAAPSPPTAPKPLMAPNLPTASTAPTAPMPQENEDTEPQLGEPVAGASQPGAEPAVEAQLILRALSQLLLEKGLIRREELVARVRALRGGGD